MTMKQVSFPLLLFIFSQGVFASTPKPCKGGDEEIHRMLFLLAKSAKSYYEANGKLPGTWSNEMANIIESVPYSNNFGNVVSVDRAQKIRITCSEKTVDGKYIHFHHDIGMNSLTIVHSLDRQVELK